VYLQIHFVFRYVFLALAHLMPMISFSIHRPHYRLKKVELQQQCSMLPTRYFPRYACICVYIVVLLWLYVLQFLTLLDLRSHLLVSLCRSIRLDFDT